MWYTITVDLAGAFRRVLDSDWRDVDEESARPLSELAAMTGQTG